MGSKQPSHTTQTTEVKLPDWVDAASESNYQLAQQIAAKPLTQYEGKDVADLSNMTTDAFSYLMSNVGAQDPLYQAAYDLQGRAGYELDPVYAQANDLYTKAAGDLDVQNYLNPYTEEVEKNAIRNANEALSSQLLGISDDARAASAFGGSRHALQAGVAQAEGTKAIGDLSAELRAAGYDQATADMLAHRGLMQGSAAGLTSSAGQQQSGWLNAASGILDTAGARGDAVSRDVASMLGAGQIEENYQQNLIDADKAKFYEARDYDLEQLNVLLSSLGMSPYGKTETTEKTTDAGSSGTDWATTILGAFTALAGLSDERDKTDIKKLGKKNKYGLPLYAFRYKDDPKSYPKVVGPMAQDVEKKYPGAVIEVGGHKTVPIGLLSNA